MDRRVIIAFVAVAAIVIAVTALWPRRVAAPAPQDLASSRESVAAQEANPVPLIPAPKKPAHVEEPPRPETRHLSGRVRSANGKEIPGVRIRWIDGSPQEATSDEHGEFSIIRPEGGGVLLLSHPRCVDTQVAVTESTDDRLGYVQMKSLTLRGSVSSTGLPIPIEVIKISGLRPGSVPRQDDVQTLQRCGGSFEFPIDDHRFFAVRFEVDGFVTEDRSLDTFKREGEYLTGAVALTPGDGILGRVQDDSGAPIAGAAIVVGGAPHDFDPDHARTHSDDMGRFWIGKPSRPANYIAATHPDFAAGFVEYIRSARVPEITITLRPGATAAGVVRVDGQPAADVAVSFRAGADAYDQISTITGSNGTYAFSRLPQGSGVVRVNMETTFTNLNSDEYTQNNKYVAQLHSIEPGGHYTQDFDIETNYGRIEGYIDAASLDERDAANELAIHLESRGRDIYIQPNHYIDPNRPGAFVVENVPPGEWTLSAYFGAEMSRAVRRVPVFIAAARTTNLELHVLGDTGSVSGVVRHVKSYFILLLEGHQNTQPEDLARMFTLLEDYGIDGHAGMAIFFEFSNELKPDDRPFAIHHLSDGDYTVVAIDLSSGTSDALALTHEARFAVQHITIAGGENVELDIRF